MQKFTPWIIILILLGLNQKPKTLKFIPDEQNTIDVFKKLSPKVVGVTNHRLTRDIFSYDITELPSGSGSGFLWDDKGHIVTNFHVVQNASRYTVSFADGENYSAKLVGTEPKKDIAVLKINLTDTKKLSGIDVSNSKELVPGQKTIAIGSPFGLEQTLTTGVVSATGRSIMGIAGVKIRDMIQTDAAINPGNSGGPLLNSEGKLIGMNTLIYSQSGSSSGVGFSVPSNTISRIVKQIIKYGRVKQPGFGFVPFPDYVPRKFGKKGVLIRTLIKGSEADKAGLKGTQITRQGQIILGDIIVEVDNQKIETFDDLYNAVEDKKIGSKITIKIIRGRSLKTLTTKLMDIGK